MFYVLCFVFCVEAQSSAIIKKNEYGTLEKRADGSLFFYQGNITEYITITTTNEQVEIRFFDGSYLYLSSSVTPIATRYSAQSNKTERFTLNPERVSFLEQWDVNNQVLDLINSFKLFDANKDAMINDVETGGYDPRPKCLFDCQYRSFDKSNSIINYDTLYSSAQSSDNCAIEINNFQNYAYNGYQSLSGCTGTAQVITGTTAFMALATCIFDPTKITCSGAIAAYGGAIANQAEVTHQCRVSFEKAKFALKVCEDEDEPDTGEIDLGDPDIGGPGSGDIQLCRTVTVVKTKVCDGGECWRQETKTVTYTPCNNLP